METMSILPRAQLEELMNAVGLGHALKEIMEDKERPVTFTEISISRQAAEYQFRKTGDMKFARIAARCEGALKAMMERAQTEGQYLHMKPSEIDNLLSPTMKAFLACTCSMKQPLNYRLLCPIHESQS